MAERLPAITGVLSGGGLRGGDAEPPVAGEVIEVQCRLMQGNGRRWVRARIDRVESQPSGCSWRCELDWNTDGAVEQSQEAGPSDSAASGALERQLLLALHQGPNWRRHRLPLK